MDRRVFEKRAAAHAKVRRPESIWWRKHRCLGASVVSNKESLWKKDHENGKVVHLLNEQLKHTTEAVCPH